MTNADSHFLTLAARCALRGAGDVEPNPLVGAVLARDGQVLGIGHHRRYGGPHAEVEAIEQARKAGHGGFGDSTLYVTLEPCSHHGKTPPCTEAIIRAGIGQVVMASSDPNPLAARGADVLRRAGTAVRFSDASPLALAIARPFVKRTTTGLPWVIAKWAQTIDGRIATRTGESKWISGSPARRRVHRLRARIDAIVTGLGTVLADDPLLTARDVARIRRVARRVVVDPELEIPGDAALIASSPRTPFTIACSKAALESPRSEQTRKALDRAGAEVLPVGPGPGGLDLEQLLRHLVREHNATNVLVESGPVLLGSLLERDLVDQALVYIAPIMLGDECATPAASGRAIERLANGSRFRLERMKQVGADVELSYVRIREA